VAAGAVGEKGGEARRKRLPGEPLIHPEGRGAAVHHCRPGDGTVEGKTLSDDLLQERGGAEKSPKSRPV
jgi:hypothetical protein